jgi:Ca2+-transporting ATPase
MGEGDPGVMERPARDPSESIITRRHWLEIIVYGLVIAITALLAFGYSMNFMGKTSSEAVTYSFLTLSFARLWHVFNMKDWRSGIIKNEITVNRWIWASLALCAGLLLIAVYIPQLAHVLDLEVPSANGWALILGLSVVPLIVFQAIKSGPIARWADITGV